MRAKARLLGHPIHPMLIVFPLGLLTVALFVVSWFMRLPNPATPGMRSNDSGVDWNRHSVLCRLARR